MLQGLSPQLKVKYGLAFVHGNDGKRAFIKTLHRAKNNNLRNARKKLREIK